jgi:exodeoxyribonuclease VII small subunit
MTTGSAEDSITALTYEAALAELDTLISKLEGGSIALEEAIGAYERGVILAQHCSDLLAHTEHRVQQLVVNGSGGLSERPLDTIGESGTPASKVAVLPKRVPPSRIDPDDVPF